MSTKLLDHEQPQTKKGESAAERFRRLSNEWPAFNEAKSKGSNPKQGNAEESNAKESNAKERHPNQGNSNQGQAVGASDHGSPETAMDEVSESTITTGRTDTRVPRLEGATAYHQTATVRRRAPLRRAIGRSFGKWIAISVAVLMIAAFGGSLLHRIWSGFNPMAQRTVDRTGPVLLEAISDLHDYRAAEGSFQVTVDIEKDAKWLPSAIRGEHVVLNAVGHVDAGVDFSNLNASAVTIDESTKAVTITLPRAEIRDAEIDLQASKIVQYKRGLLDRLGSTFGDAPSTDRTVYNLAEQKLLAAAKASDLVTRAEANTRQMLTALTKGLGHERVTIVFLGPIVITNTFGPPMIYRQSDD